jgi:hypothetical protein
MVLHPDPWRRSPPDYIGGIVVRFPFLKSKTFWGVVSSAAVYLLKVGLSPVAIAETIAAASIALGLRDGMAKNGPEGEEFAERKRQRKARREAEKRGGGDA